jgi:multiple sugar transport system substrate-binding protein
VGAYTAHEDMALEAVECITSEEQQVQYAVETANMPAREGAYDDPALKKQFPADLLELFQTSIEGAGPRPASPYWSTIVSGVLSKWHPADSVDPDSTPEESASFIGDALQGDALL